MVVHPLCFIRKSLSFIYQSLSFIYREGWDSSRQELSFFMKRYVSFSQHRHIEQEVLVDDHVDHGKEKLCMCPRSSLRAYVVGRVRGPCCGTCSGPMLWDDMPYPVTDSNRRGPPRRSCRYVDDFARGPPDDRVDMSTIL